MANPIGNMVIRVDLDGSGFNKGIAGLNRQMRMVSREMSANLSQFGRYDQSLEKSKLRVDGLTKRQRLQAQKVKELRARYNQLSKETGENSARTQAAASEYNKAYAELGKYERELAAAKEEMKALERQQQVLSSTVGKIGQKFTEWGPKLKEIGSQMQSIGRSMSMYVTAPVVAGFGAAVKKSIDFDDSMRKVKATSGATSGEFQQLRDKALEMGAKTKFSASQSAEALNYMALAGWDTKDMLNGIDGIMQLAAASGEDLGLVSDIVTDSLTAFGLKAKDSTHFADVLAQTSSKANTDVRGLGEAFKYAAPVAGALGYTVEDTSIAIGLMSNAGIKGEKAGTALRTMFTNLAKPTKAMQNRMDELGISITDSNGEMLPMRDVMDQLRDRFKNLSKDQQASAAATIFGKEAMSGALAVINASDEDYKKLTKSIDDSAGASKRMSDEMEGGIGGSIRQMKSSIESLAISIGDILAPYLKKMAEWLSDVAVKLNSMPKSAQKMVVGIGLVAAAIGPLLVTLGIMVSTIGSAMTVLGPLLTSFRTFSLISRTTSAAVGLFTGVQKIWNATVGASRMIAIGLSNAVMRLGNSQTLAAMKTKIANTAIKVWEATTKLAAIATRGLGLAIRFMTGPIGLVITAVGLLVAGVIHLWNTNEGFRTAIINIWNHIKDFLINTWENIKIIAQISWQFIRQAIENPIKKAREVLSRIFTSIKDHTIQIWKAIKTGVTQIVKSWWAFMNAYFRMWKSVITTIFNSIKNFFIKIWNTIKNKVLGIVKSLVNGVKSHFTKLYASVRTIFTNLKNWLTKTWSNIRNTVVKYAKSLWTGVRNTFNAMSKGIRNIMNSLKNFLYKIWKNIKNTVTKYASQLWAGVKKTFNNMFSGLRNISNKIKKSVTASWKDIKKSVTGTASSMWSSVKKTFNNMNSGLKTIIGKIKGSINGMVKSVKDGLNNLIKGVNWVGDKLGMKKLPSIKLHTGTESTHTQKFITNGKINRDTFATVGDKGRGNGPGGFRHETIEYPNGKMALTPNRDTTAFLPKGSKVYNGAQTHSMLSSLPRFSFGTNPLGNGNPKPKKKKKGDDLFGDAWDATKAGAAKVVDGGKAVVSKVGETVGKGAKWLKDTVGDVYDWVEKPGKLLDKILEAFGVNLDAFGISKSASLPYDMMKGMFGKLKSAATKLIGGWLEEAGDGDGGYIDLWRGVNFGFHPTAASALAAGYPFARAHHGIDVNYPYGTKVRSTVSGKATGTHGYNGGFGNMMKIVTGAMEVIYGHLSKLNWTGAKQVKPGTVLGLSGGDPGRQGAGAGSSTGPHLHYEMRWNGVAKDPIPWLKKNNGSGKGGSQNKAASAWRGDIKRAAKKMGVSVSGQDVNNIISLIHHESGGNAGVTQSTAVRDINAITGNLAQGLLQYVPGTFNNYKVKGYGNIKNGYHQLLAFFNNKYWRSQFNPNGGWSPSGPRRFASGGLIQTAGWYNLAEGGYPEWVIPTDPALAGDAAKLLALASKDVSKNKRPNQLRNVSSSSAENNFFGGLEQKLDKVIGLLTKLVAAGDTIADKDYQPTIDKYTHKQQVFDAIDDYNRQKQRKLRF